MSELELIYEKLDNACCPEEVFGTGDDPGVVFRKLAAHSASTLATSGGDKAARL